MASNQKPTKQEQSLFEEDDEFEEFPAEGTSMVSWGSVACVLGGGCGNGTL